MLSGVMLAGLFGVVRSVVQVVVSGLFVIAGVMVASGGLMMFRGMFVVLRRSEMMLHGIFGTWKFSLKAKVQLSAFSQSCHDSTRRL